MDEFETEPELTLVRLCEFKIISHVMGKFKIPVRGDKRSIRKYLEQFTLLGKLKLPANVRRQMSYYMSTVISELKNWREYQTGIIQFSSSGPVFTLRGTIDRAKTAQRTVEDESQPVCARFALACAYCLESHIPKLMKMLTPDEIKTMEDITHENYAYAQGWLNIPHKVAAYENGGRLLDVLDVKVLYVMATLALIMHHDVVFKFLDNIPLKRAQTCIDNSFHILQCTVFKSYPTLSYHKLFKKLSQDQQKRHIGTYSFHILLAFLPCPYYRKFVAVSRSLVDNLNGLQYKHIWNEILTKTNMSKDHDYAPLLYCFWELGSDRKNEFFRKPTSDDRRLINLVRDTLVQHGYPDIVKKDKPLDEALIKKMATLFNFYTFD